MPMLRTVTLLCVRASVRPSVTVASPVEMAQRDIVNVMTQKRSDGDTNGLAVGLRGAVECRYCVMPGT